MSSANSRFIPGRFDFYEGFVDVMSVTVEVSTTRDVPFTTSFQCNPDRFLQMMDEVSRFLLAHFAEVGVLPAGPA